MKITGKGKMLKIFIGENDKYRGKPLFDAIVQRLQKEGLIHKKQLKRMGVFFINF